MDPENRPCPLVCGGVGGSVCPTPARGVPFQALVPALPPSSAPPAPQKLPWSPPRAGQARREALDPLLAKQEYRARHGDTAPQPRGGTRPGPAGHGGYGINSHVWPRARKPPNSRGLGGTGCSSPPCPSLECSRVTPCTVTLCQQLPRGAGWGDRHPVIAESWMGSNPTGMGVPQLWWSHEKPTTGPTATGIPWE